MEEEAVKVCRLCMKLLFKEKYFDINYVEGATGFMPFRDQITTCMPELALDILPECYICLNCADSLKASYDFKTKCLHVEDKVRNYFDGIQTTDDFSMLKLSKFVRYTDTSADDEVEISECNIPEVEKSVDKSPEPDEIVKIQDKKCENDCMQVVYKCLICKACFNDPKALVRHKKATHKSPFVCNFCNKQFESLFFLRQHNTLCKNKEGNEESVSAASAKSSHKRPHLPAKAKNHLTEWLYHHQSHPYPTDYEKQCLMKETNLSLVQVENWFINARRRVLIDFSRRKRFASKIKKLDSSSTLDSA